MINASQASDSGEYKCVVSNDAGAAEATAHLQVFTAPVITTPPIAKGEALHTTPHWLWHSPCQPENTAAHLLRRAGNGAAQKRVTLANIHTGLLFLLCVLTVCYPLIFLL